MSYIPPTLSEIREQISSGIESKTGDNVPIYEKAFYNIIANVVALISYPIYKYISWNYRQSFVNSCDEFHLENFHGADEGVSRKYATKTEFDVELTVTTPTVVSVSTTFENEATGLFYFPTQSKSVTVADNAITLVAGGYGTEYAVSVGDELKITGAGIDGVDTLCTVDSISVYASDVQDLEDYRKDVLSSRSGVTGGSTANDFRKWGQAVAGVKRIFPFSGTPYTPETALPGDISVYIEASDDLGTDGVATASLIQNVRDALITDPDTGLERLPLGTTESVLSTSSVTRVYFLITINDLVVDASVETELKESIENAIGEYLRSLCPFVPSIDPEYERNDNVSSITVSDTVNKILKQFSAIASSVTVNEVGVGLVDNRQLIGGDIARLSSIVYA